MEESALVLLRGWRNSGLFCTFREMGLQSRRCVIGRFLSVKKGYRRKEEKEYDVRKGVREVMLGGGGGRLC